MDYNVMLNRVIRAARLDVSFYEEAETNTALTQEALMVVVIVSLLSGIGSFLGGLFTGIGAAFIGLILAVVLGVVGYYIWAYVTHWVGTNLFHGTATVDELLRTLGYANGPRALGFFAFIPCIGPLIGLAGAIWALVAGVVAVRQALNFDTTNAVVTVLIGWIIVMVISVVLGVLLGVGAFGASAVGSLF
jgi:hypothetical protein